MKKSKLNSVGFNFDYHTHTYIIQAGKTYHFCYEYGFLLLNDDELLLVKRDEKLWLS